uniref:Vacuolar protein sorting-associated protein 51 homolog n=1 Tax=Tetradesmus obliquus TaxID=3088 RepID=A0A383VMJ6_TETOB|eukprot:jgi/Sobl393_1/10513/SZX65972.1
MEEDYARRTERIKNLLSSFYGNADQQQAAAGASGAAGTASPAAADVPAASVGSSRPLHVGGGTTLDSPAFNAEQHIAVMTKTYSVDRLLTEHRSMAREIKNLDSDMQQLVYENYNKFIAATDTIRAMKTNVDGMESDMERLKTNMDTVADKSSAVNQKLLKRRQQVEELNRVQNLLTRLQAVFDLPGRMQAALEEDALGAAVGFYSEALPLLRKYGHRGAFRGIAAEADAAARQVSAALKRRLAERKDDTEQAVLLLRKLGEADDTLQEKYLQGRSERMTRILQEAAAVAAVMAAVSQQPGGAAVGGSSSSSAAAVPAGVESPEAWGFAANGTPPSLPRFVKALDERLMNTMRETVMNVNGIFLQGDQSAARRKPLLAMAKDIIGEYFKLIRRTVGDSAMSAVATAACLHLAGGDKDFSATSPSLDFPDNWGTDTVMAAMSAVTTDIGLLHSQLPELSLRDWAAAATEQAVRGHIAAAFGALQERISSGVRMVTSQLASQDGDQAPVQPLSPAYGYLSEVIQRGIAALLKGLRVYEQHGRLLASFQDQLSDAVQGQLQALFQSLVSSFLAAAKIKDASATSSSSSSESSRQPSGAEPSTNSGDASGSSAADDPPKTGLVLLLAKLAMFMEDAVVPAVMEVLAGSFQGRSGFRASDEPPPFVGGEVARRLGTAANLLLGSYVDLHGRSLSLLLQRSVGSTNWLHAQPPRAPRPVCDLLLERLGRCEAELSRLVDASGRGAGPAGAPQHQRVGSSSEVLLESAAVERGMAKLFRGKVQPFGASGLRFTQSALLAAVAIVGLKSLVEFIRLQTLGKAGLQQLQLDMYYMRPRLLRLLGGPDAEAVGQLLDEVVAAAAERSTDPTMLETATLEKALLALSRQ